MANDETLRAEIFDAAREWGVADDQYAHDHTTHADWMAAQTRLDAALDAALAAAEARGVEKQRARTTIVLRVLYRALREDAAAMVKRLDDAAFDTYATGATEGSDV